MISWGVTAASVQDTTGGRAMVEQVAAQHPSVKTAWVDSDSVGHSAQRRYLRKPPHEQAIPALDPAEETRSGFRQLRYPGVSSGGFPSSRHPS